MSRPVSLVVVEWRAPQPPKELKHAVTAYPVVLADGLGRWDQEQAVVQQVAHHKLDAGNVFQTYAEAVRTNA